MEDPIPALLHLQQTLTAKAAAFDPILKSAGPSSWMLSRSAWARSLRLAEQTTKGLDRAAHARAALLELALG